SRAARATGALRRGARGVLGAIRLRARFTMTLVPSKAIMNRALARGRRPVGGGEEEAAEARAELLPLVDPVAQLVNVPLRVWYVFLPRVPLRDLLDPHLGMELHAPRAVPDADRLRAHVRARELDRSLRHAEGVAVSH